jgi:hypothetical protein
MVGLKVTFAVIHDRLLMATQCSPESKFFDMLPEIRDGRGSPFLHRLVNN